MATSGNAACGADASFAGVAAPGAGTSRGALESRAAESEALFSQYLSLAEQLRGGSEGVVRHFDVD